MNSPPKTASLGWLALALLLVASLPGNLARAATLTVVNDDAAGEGFNDPTPAAALPGNPGTTLGDQRLNVFEAAANAWGAILESSVEIPIIAGFDPLFCNTNSALLGGAGNTIWISGGTLPRADTQYPFALANALAGFDISPLIGLPAGTPNIGATFNSDVDTDPDCLTGITWWYGIGMPAPAGTLDFYTTVLHEIAHGLGFATPVNGDTGERLGDIDDIFMVFLEDHSSGKTWPEMSNLERAASTIDTGDLHWVGVSAVVRAGAVLTSGVHPSGHIRMYAPDPAEPGSSISHWDTVLAPNELMEPFLNAGAQNRITTQLLEDIGWPLTAGLKGMAGLIVPGFEVEVDAPLGPTTFFAVRNTSDEEVTVNVNYYGDQLGDAPLRTDVFVLGPQETLPANVRFNLTDLEVVDGFATGVITIDEGDGLGAPNLEGDYFRLDDGEDFATGDRLVRPTDFCTRQEVRFVDFGSGSQLRVLVDRPLGEEGPTFSYTAYDQAGVELLQGDFSTSNHLNVIDVADLGIAENFGTVVFDFTTAGGGFVTGKYSAFGRFSVELNAACRMQ